MITKECVGLGTRHKKLELQGNLLGCHTLEVAGEY